MKSSTPLAELCAAALVALQNGCERKERVLEVEAPGVDIEVNRLSKGRVELDLKTRD